MMDRNLGATSATPGDAGALGLLYQWGRKDPFPGASSISENIAAKATLVRWPQELISEGVSIDYTVQNPTKIISTFHGVYDWLLTEDGSMDNTRWQAEKTIYDPCPAGYRVPDGGENGVWGPSAPRLTLRRYMTVQTRVSTSGRRVNPNTSSPKTPTAGIRLPESTIRGNPHSLMSVSILPVAPVPHKTKGSAFS